MSNFIIYIHILVYYHLLFCPIEIYIKLRYIYKLALTITNPHKTTQGPINKSLMNNVFMTSLSESPSPLEWPLPTYISSST